MNCGVCMQDLLHTLEPKCITYKETACATSRPYEKSERHCRAMPEQPSTFVRVQGFYGRAGWAVASDLTR